MQISNLLYARLKKFKNFKMAAKTKKNMVNCDSFLVSNDKSLPKCYFQFIAMYFSNILNGV